MSNFIVMEENSNELKISEEVETIGLRNRAMGADESEFRRSYFRKFRKCSRGGDPSFRKSK